MKTNKFSFTGKRQLSIVIAIALIISIVVISAVVGANKSVTMGGGTVIQYAYTGEIDAEELQEVLNDVVTMPYTLQTGERVIIDEEVNAEAEQPEEEKPEGSGEESAGVQEETEGENAPVVLTNQLMVIRLQGSKSFSNEEVANLTSILQEKYSGNNIRLIAISSVSSALSQDDLMKLAVTVALICLIAFVYVSQRYKNISGVTAGVITVVNMLYVSLFTYGVYVALKISFTAASFAVIVATMVYSVIEIIVALAHIKESRNLHDKKTSITSITNESLNQLLSRTTTIAIIVIVTAGAIGGYAFTNSIRSITALIIPLATGILFSLYSAMFFAIPIWAVIVKGKSPSKKAK